MWSFKQNILIQQWLIILFKKMSKQKLIFQILFCIFIVQIHCQQLYNPGSTSYRNQTWMTNLDFGLPVRQISMLGTHNSLGFEWCFVTGGFQQTQSNSLQVQLESGIRALDIRVKHQSNKFQLYDRSCNLNVNFDTVLTTVKNFLISYPGETVLLHLVEQQSSSGCSRSFEDTYKYYRDTYAPLIWTPTSQDPQLGEVKGKILLLQQFTATEVHGLLWATFTILPNKKMSTNWDLYSKWLALKAFLPSANAAKKSQISFWTGHGGSYPYFVVSGKSSRTGGQLSTALTTPGFKSSYPDFPRIWCFIGICTIAFQGMNIMGYNYIVSQNYAYTGIVFTDFYGDDLLKRIVGRNQATYAKCIATKVAQGCTLCALSTGTCIKCNTLMNYIYDSVNKICLAKVGYYLDGSYIPQLCASAEPGCMQCLSATVCTKCDTIGNYLLATDSCIAAPGYYLDPVTFVPIACPEIGCAECLDDLVCTVCSSATNYIMDPVTTTTCMCDGINYFQSAIIVQACICMPEYYLAADNTCQPMPKCPDMSGGCLNCGTAPTDTVCLQCDTANNFIYDPTHIFCICNLGYYFDGIMCAQCTVNDAACSKCAGPSLCLACMANFTLIAGKCQCIPQYYLVDSDTCEICSVGCLSCTAMGACTVCDAGNNFALVGGYCQCVVGMFELSGVCYVCGAMAGCLDCNTAGCTLCDPMFGFHLNNTQCQCDYGFYVNPMKVCEKCMMQGCLNCIDQDICIQCNQPEYYLNSTALCDDTCGDGIRIYVDCDDGNLINGDGCSNMCKVQTDYTCTGGSTITRDVCSYSGPFNLTVIKSVKDKKKNKVYIDIVIQPNIASLTGIDFSMAINPTFSFQSKLATFNTTQSLISFQFTYNTSLNSLTSSDLGVTFDPPNSEAAYYYMKAASFTLPDVTDNNMALKYYDDNIYNLLDVMKTLTEVTAFLYVGICLICFIFLSKIMAIQLILVPQVAFAGLIMIQKIESLLEPLNNFRLTNGYNPLFTDTNQLPPRLSILFYQGDFLSNFNVCMVVLMIPVFVGLFLFILSRVRNSKIILKYSFQALKQWTFSVLLIFQFQFTISFGIDFFYGSGMIGKALGGLLFVGLLCLIVLLYKKPLNFGEFRNYFKSHPIFLNHYIFVVFFRLFLALDLIILSSNKACGFVAIGIAALYTLFLIISRPYLKNVRPIINMFVIVMILVIESVYKLNFYSSDAQFMTSYLPLFIVIALLVLLFINVVFMILEIRQKYKKNQIDKYQKNQDFSFDHQLKKELQRQMEVINTIQMALSPSNLNKIKEKQKVEAGDKTPRVKGYKQSKELQKTLLKPVAFQGSPIELTEQDKLVYVEI